MDEEKAEVMKGAVQHLAPPLVTSFNQVLILMGIAINPAWTIVLSSAYGLFGLYLYSQQEKLNSFIAWIRDHRGEFTEDLVQQPAFQEGFIATLETYMRTRGDGKLSAIRNVFLGFTKMENKEAFELERLYSVIQTISYDSLEYLSFIDETILPDLVGKIDGESIRLSQIPASKGGMSREGWRMTLQRDETVSAYIKKWIHDEFDPNSAKIKARPEFDGEDLAYLAKLNEAKKPHEKRFSEASAEYISLGIFRTVSRISTLELSPITHSEYTLTDFGWKLLRFLKTKPSVNNEV